MTTANPTQAMLRKRMPATVTVAFSDPSRGSYTIPSPSLPAWLGYAARTPGLTAEGLTRTFTDSAAGATVTLELGAKR